MPSLPSFIGLINPTLSLPFLTIIWTAILVCLEHSFWIAQQGSNSIDSFDKAWKFYLSTQYTLVDQELDNYLKLTGSDDWFTNKHTPSEEECAQCRKIVLNNLLCKFHFYHLCAEIADISLAHSKIFTWSHQDLLGCIMACQVYCQISVLLDIMYHNNK